MKLKWEKGRPKTIDLIVTDGETTESVFSQSGDQSETSQPGDQSETGGITETTTKEPPAQAGPESSVLRPVSVQTQKVIDEFQTNTLDYETEKLLIFSKNEIMKIKEWKYTFSLIIGHFSKDCIYLFRLDWFVT